MNINLHGHLCLCSVECLYCMASVASNAFWMIENLYNILLTTEHNIYSIFKLYLDLPWKLSSKSCAVAVCLSQPSRSLQWEHPHQGPGIYITHSRLGLLRIHLAWWLTGYSFTFQCNLLNSWLSFFYFCYIPFFISAIVVTEQFIVITRNLFENE